MKPPQRLVHEALQLSAARMPDKPAILAEGRCYSYKELLESAQRLAGALKRQGITSGDRVLLWLDNGWAAAASVYGVWLAGGVVVAINPQTKPDKFLFIARDCEAAALIGESRLVQPLADELGAVEGFRYVAETRDNGPFDSIGWIFEHEPPLKVPHPVIATDLAALIYTSGSTGEPKGVMHSHQTIVFAATSIIEYLRLSEQDRVLCVLPLAFDYGLYQLLMAVQIGATLVLEKSFAFPAKVIERLEEEQVTVLPGVPTLFASLVDLHQRNGRTFPFVQRVTNTAAALPEALMLRLQRVFPKALLFSMYGLTECKRATYLEPEELEKRPGSVGKAIPGTDAYILREDGTRALPGETGILHVRGPHVMLGYWHRPEQTAKMLRPGFWPGERVLCTQDLFRADDEGYLYFAGRTDDIIKSRGEKVSPIEVERVLCGIEGVYQAAVIGVNDPILGQAIHAFIETDGTIEMDSSYLKAACSQKLEPYMVPKRFEVVDTLPRTANGKVDKRAISAKHEQVMIERTRAGEV